MRILITNNALHWRTGTELYVLDIARRLQALGHMPMAYSIDLGPVAADLRKAGVPVVSDLAQLPFQPDIIHGQHHVETITALLCLPGTPAVYFCHGAIPWEEMAPTFPRIHRYVAVDQPCLERMICEHGIPEEKIRLLLNFADLQRFQPRPPLPIRPKRALIYSNGSPESDKIIRAACAKVGVELDVVGNRAGNRTSTPETVLPGYDLVFAKARAAIEAMAVGCSVILLTPKGCGPLVTSKNFDRLRPLNFGYRAGLEPVTEEFIAAQLASYDAADAGAVSKRIRAEADLNPTVDRLVQIYQEVIDAHRQTPADPAAESRAAGIYFQWFIPMIKRSPKWPSQSKYRLFEKAARLMDKTAFWLRS